MKADLIVEFWRRETDLGVCKEKLGRDAGLLDPIPTTFRRPETDHHHRRYSHALEVQRGYCILQQSALTREPWAPVSALSHTYFDLIIDVAV